MLACAGNYWLEIKQLLLFHSQQVFCNTQSCRATPYSGQTLLEYEQLWLNLFFWEKKGPEAIDKQEAEVSVKEDK